MGSHDFFETKFLKYGQFKKKFTAGSEKKMFLEFY